MCLTCSLIVTKKIWVLLNIGSAYHEKIEQLLGKKFNIATFQNLILKDLIK